MSDATDNRFYREKTSQAKADDLVEKLRAGFFLREESAAEIERLRAQLAAAEADGRESNRLAAENFKRAKTAEAQLSLARKALEPFANCVFNDNGDVTVSTSNLQIDDYYKAYRFLRSLHPNGEGNAG